MMHDGFIHRWLSHWHLTREDLVAFFQQVLVDKRTITFLELLMLVLFFLIICVGSLN